MIVLCSEKGEALQRAGRSFNYQENSCVYSTEQTRIGADGLSCHSGVGLLYASAEVRCFKTWSRTALGRGLVERRSKRSWSFGNNISEVHWYKSREDGVLIPEEQSLSRGRPSTHFQECSRASITTYLPYLPQSHRHHTDISLSQKRVAHPIAGWLKAGTRKLVENMKTRLSSQQWDAKRYGLSEMKRGWRDLNIAELRSESWSDDEEWMYRNKENQSLRLCPLLYIAFLSNVDFSPMHPCAES